MFESLILLSVIIITASQFLPEQQDCKTQEPLIEKKLTVPGQDRSAAHQKQHRPRQHTIGGADRKARLGSLRTEASTQQYNS